MSIRIRERRSGGKQPAITHTNITHQKCGHFLYGYKLYSIRKVKTDRLSDEFAYLNFMARQNNMDYVEVTAPRRNMGDAIIQETSFYNYLSSRTQYTEIEAGYDIFNIKIEATESFIRSI